MDLVGLVLIVLISFGQQSLTDIYYEFFRERVKSAGLAMTIALFLAFFTVIFLILLLGWIGGVLR